MAGTMVRATNSEATREKATDKANPRVIIPVSPVANAMGRKTTIVVKVEAVMAIPTSEAPSRAAERASLPSWI